MVDDHRADKPGLQVALTAEVRLKQGSVLRYVSRGGLKLEAALDHFRIDPSDKVCADLGASTGGFTDCLLQRGAARVHACDVGHGQLDQKIARDPRVRVHDRLTVRSITREVLGEGVAICTIDVSFISLRLVLSAARGLLLDGGTLIALVKPQFEVGPENLAKGGVVRDEAIRRAAISDMASFAAQQSFAVTGTLDSPVHGPAGNIEALLVATAT